MRGSKHHAIAAHHIFDGESLHAGRAVVVEGEHIVALVPRRDLPSSTSIHDLPAGAWLAPGFVDLQVNGGGDVLFNDEPTVDGIAAIVAAHRKFGTTSLLPTLITDTDEKMRQARNAVQTAMQRDLGVLGIHFEGPFLSPQKPGVHNPQFIRKPQQHHRELLAGLREGVILVTLAPEQVPAGFMGELAGAGVKLSLGHSMATYAQTCAAIQEGLTGFTHLFNAMRPLDSREPGPIAAALESPKVWYGLIVDGVHVDPAMLRLALRGAGQPFLVTDAMPPVGGTRREFHLYGEEVIVENGRCATKDGTLAGSTLDMASAVRNCVRLLRISLEQALRLASRHPAEFVGLGDRLGRIAPGYRADLVAIQPAEVQILDMWVAGEALSLGGNRPCVNV